MTALLEIARTVSAIGRDLRPKDDDFHSQEELDPSSDPSDILVSIVNDIEAKVVKPYFKVTKWEAIEVLWDELEIRFKPLWERLLFVILQRVRIENFPTEKDDAQYNMLSRMLTHRLMEPIRSNIDFSIRTLVAANKMIIKRHEEVLNRMGKDKEFEKNLFTSLSNLSLAVMMLAYQLDHNLSPKNAGDEHIDFAVIAAKRYSAAVYMAVFKATKR